MPSENTDKSANVFLVTVRIEGEKGSATIACRGLQQDPLFSGKVVLVDVQGLSWPFQGHFAKVQQWSLDKDAILNWMLGPLRDTFDISVDMLQGGSQEVPWTPGTLPNAQLVNHPEDIHKAVVKDPPKVHVTPPSDLDRSFDLSLNEPINVAPAAGAAVEEVSGKKRRGRPPRG